MQHMWKSSYVFRKFLLALLFIFSPSFTLPKLYQFRCCIQIDCVNIPMSVWLCRYPYSGLSAFEPAVCCWDHKYNWAMIRCIYQNNRVAELRSQAFTAFKWLVGSSNLKWWKPHHPGLLTALQQYHKTCNEFADLLLRRQRCQLWLAEDAALCWF